MRTLILISILLISTSAFSGNIYQKHLILRRATPSVLPSVEMMYEGELVRVYAEVENYTNIDINKSFDVCFKMVKKEQYRNIKEFWLNSTPGITHQVTIPKLEKKSKKVIQFNKKIIRKGEWHPRILADCHEDIAETNEADNEIPTKLPMQVIRKYNDLSVKVFYKGSRPRSLKKKTFYFEVKNEGTTKSLPSKLEVIFKKSRAGTKTYKIPSLKPGQFYKLGSEAKATFSHSHRYRKRGKKTIQAKIYHNSNFFDNNKRNDTFTYNFKVR